MMRKHIQLLLILLILLSITVFGQERIPLKSIPSCPTPQGYILDREVCDYGIDWKNLSITEALMKSFGATDVPAGVSILLEKADENESRQDLTPNNLFLSDVLAKITTVETRYQWNEEDGVINVFPTDNYSILNEIIPTFKFDNKTKNELLGKLKETKQFNKYLRENNISAPLLLSLGGLVDPRPPRRFSVDMKDATVREILNEIVRRNGSSTWLYREYESSFNSDKEIKKYYSLYFLVSTY